MAKRKDQASNLAAVASLRDVRLPVPGTVRAEDGRLLWNLRDDWREIGPAADALSAFARLAVEEGDREFAKFARRWGVLGLLPNGLPGVLNGDLPPTERRFHVEPIAGWRGYARHARAILFLTYELQEAKERIDPKRILMNAGFPRAGLSGRFDPDHVPVPADELPWGRFGLLSLPLLIGNLDRVGGRPEYQFTEEQRKFWEKPPLQRQREWFSHHIATTWLAFGQVAPDIEWTDGKPQVVLSLSNRNLQTFVLNAWPQNTLVSVLAIQMAAAVMFEALTPCRSCGLPFMASRSRTCPACRHYANREYHRGLEAGKRANARRAASRPDSN